MTYLQQLSGQEFLEKFEESIRIKKYIYIGNTTKLSKEKVSEPRITFTCS